jgi:hypothetical protein
MAKPLTSILDGAPFLQLAWKEGDVTWILEQRGKHMDPSNG